MKEKKQETVRLTVSGPKIPRLQWRSVLSISKFVHRWRRCQALAFREVKSSTTEEKTEIKRKLDSRPLCPQLVAFVLNIAEKSWTRSVIIPRTHGNVAVVHESASVLKDGLILSHTLIVYFGGKVQNQVIPIKVSKGDERTDVFKRHLGLSVEKVIVKGHEVTVRLKIPGEGVRMMTFDFCSKRVLWLKEILSLFAKREPATV